MKYDVEDLNGFEMIELKKVLGKPLEQADGIESTYALAYLFKKREDADVKYNDVLALTIKQIQEYLGVDDAEETAMPFEDDPKA